VQVTYQGKIVTPQSLQYRPKAKSEETSTNKSNILGLRKKALDHDHDDADSKQKQLQQGKL